MESGSYFTNLKNRQTLIEAVGSWKGTHFKHGKMVKGRAVDCALYVASLLLETGVFKSIIYERVPRQWAAHVAREVLLDGYLAQFKERMAAGVEARELSSVKELQFGDVLFFSTSPLKVSNHCAVKLDEFYMTCALEARGVCVMELSKVWRNRLTHAFRIESHG